MKALAWHAVDRRTLATLLRESPSVASQAVGEATVYQIESDGREVLAIALPDGATVIVQRPAPPAAKRRRVDAKKSLSQ
jgi:hypothetical protein